MAIETPGSRKWQNGATFTFSDLERPGQLAERLLAKSPYYRHEDRFRGTARGDRSLMRPYQFLPRPGLTARLDTIALIWHVDLNTFLRDLSPGRLDAFVIDAERMASEFGLPFERFFWGWQHGGLTTIDGESGWFAHQFLGLVCHHCAYEPPFSDDLWPSIDEIHQKSRSRFPDIRVSYCYRSLQTDIAPEDTATAMAFLHDMVTAQVR
jgi:hypothetical protein